MEKFYKFRADVILNTFQIRSVNNCEQLANWLNAKDSLTDFESIKYNVSSELIKFFHNTIFEIFTKLNTPS